LERIFYEHAFWLRAFVAKKTVHGGVTMGSADWAFWVAVATLGYLALLAWQLVHAMWDGRAFELSPASMTVAFVLIAATILSLPRGDRNLTLVAGVAVSAPVASDESALEEITVSGNRIHLIGRRAEDADGVWAMIEDPRTGTLWLQGPATQSGSRWVLDLIVGPEVAPRGPLPYRVSVSSVSPETHNSWLAAAQLGILVLPAFPSDHVWLTHNQEVIIGL
jgi:hypothetical protein